MSRLTAIGLGRSRVTVLVMLLMLAIGALSYAGFPKREDPAITVRTAVVAAANPGLEVEQVEELVARPIEEAARAIPGVSEVRTQITGGAAIVRVDIADAVPEADLKRVMDEIRDDAAALSLAMPEGTQGPVVDTDFGDVAIATVAVTGAGFSLPEVEEAAEDLRDRLYALDAVAAVTMHGAQDEVITLELDRARLASVGETLDPVPAAIRGQNVRLPAGSVVAAGVRVPLEATGDLHSVEEIEALLVEMPDLGLVRLGDLVSVRRGTVEPAERPVFQDGAPALVLAVEMEEGGGHHGARPRPARDGEGLRNVPARRHRGCVLDLPARDRGGFGQRRAVNMAQTFAVVLGVMLLFLGWREALVVAAIVPFAVSFAFALMGPFGVELQQVSIAAIIISLGLLVDNGVVVVEDMERRIAGGAPRHDAALAAGRQYATPLLIASITTVAAFLPLFLLDGTEGQYGYSLGVVVMLMLAGSFLAALSLLPRLAAWVIAEPRGKTREGREGAFGRLAGGYARLVRGVVRAPLVAIVLVAAVVVAGAAQFGRVPNQLFPLSERAQFLAYIDLPRGTDIAGTRETALRLSRWLTGGSNPEVTGVTTYVGSGGPRFVLSLDPADTDPASAFMVVNTDDFEGSAAVIDRARAHVAEVFPEASIRLKRLAMGGREPGVDVEISGPDGDRLMAAAYAVQAAFATAPGLVQNRNDWGAKRLTGALPHLICS